MSEIWSKIIVIAVIMFGCVPLATLVFRYIFRKSIISKLAVYTITTCGITAVEGYILASMELIHITWLTVAGMVAFYMNFKLVEKISLKPLQELTNTIIKLSKGNLNVEVNENLRKENNEVGKITLAMDELVKSLKESVHLSQMIAAGKLYSATQKIANKELNGDLDMAMEKMMKQLNKTLQNINSSIYNITSGASQLATSSQNVSTGANQQAASIEEISTSMEQMVASINQNADNANQTKNMSEQSANNIKLVQEAMVKSIQSMKIITEKLNIIRDIAGKTNLLAINAAVEAARAGVHGKGFNVVAGEVRKLAENSQKASETITDLAQVTLQDAQNSGELLEKTIPDIFNTSQLVQEISAASSEQKNNVDQINSAIIQLNDVTQQNASASEELAGTSQTFSNQAQNLKKSISFFRLNKEQEGLLKDEILKKIDEMNEYVREHFSTDDKYKDNTGSGQHGKTIPDYHDQNKQDNIDNHYENLT